MTTVLDVITRAHRKLGISGQGEALSAEMAAEGLDALNDLMEAWNLHGINRTHTTLALADPFPMAPKFVEGTVYLLAQRLGPNYEVPPTFDPRPFFRALQAAFAVVDEVTLPTALTRLPSSRLTGRGPDY
jgi:hypothetical protein